MYPCKGAKFTVKGWKSDGDKNTTHRQLGLRISDETFECHRRSILVFASNLNLAFTRCDWTQDLYIYREPGYALSKDPNSSTHYRYISLQSLLNVTT